MKSSAPKSYDTVSRINHWVIAAAMIAMLGVGLYLNFGGLDREEEDWLQGVHMATGVLVLIYGVWRVGWRLMQGFPGPADPMPAWQEKAAAYTHWLLLAGILLMPISGLMRALFGDHAVDVFGLFTIPGLGEVVWLSAPARFVHTYFGYALVAIVLVHVAGALKHHLIDRDGTLLRMLSGKTFGGRSD
ncbi:cytochrome b [Halomonas sp. M20]|uniref:cytochrome b n=1 Tax=Halomonas sp. M20 TaxID=2763264 RepID=UPI001D0BCF22|nr:cytochrome b [Halomonas sp. M20]